MGTRALGSITVSVTMGATVQNTLNDSKITQVKHPDLNYQPNLSNGADASQANRGWQEAIAITSGGNVVLDLYDLSSRDIGAGSGLDGVGQTVVFEEIVGIAILNNNAVAAAGILEIEPDATNGWDPIGIHTAALGGGLSGQGLFVKMQPAEVGFDVTDASNHRIKLTASGGDVDAVIYLLARHDDDVSSSSTSSSTSSSPSSSSSSSSSSISTSSTSSS